MKPIYFLKRAYLAVAYSRGDFSERAKVADIAAAYVAEELRLSVFSPISQSHRIARYVSAGHLSHEFWLGQDARWLEVADVVVILEDEMLKKSFGVAWELGWAAAMEKEIIFVSWSDVEAWYETKINMDVGDKV